MFEFLKGRTTMRLAPAVTALALMAVAAPANAASFTFAQFSQSVSSAKIFTYTDLLGGATLTTSGSQTVLISDLGTLVSPSTAFINMTATSSVLPVLNGSTITQLFSGSITFTLLAPQLGMSGLSTSALTVNFTDAKLLTSTGSKAPTFSADIADGATISYMSDFADLSGLVEKNFALSFSSASKATTLVAGHLPSFTMSGTGTFAGGVPEPMSWALMTIGFGAIGAASRSSRRRPAATFTA